MRYCGTLLVPLIILFLLYLKYTYDLIFFAQAEGEGKENAAVAQAEKPIIEDPDAEAAAEAEDVVNTTTAAITVRLSRFYSGETV